MENVDQERFDRLRSVELKHGRVSMLAVLGHIVTSNGIRLPVRDRFRALPSPAADRPAACRLRPREPTAAPRATPADFRASFRHPLI